MWTSCWKGAATPASDHRRSLALIILLLLTLPSCATRQGPDDAVIQEVAVTPGAFEIAEAALAEGDYPEAIERYQLILREQPNSASARLGLGEAYLGTGANKEALAAFAAIPEEGDVANAARQGQGIALLRLGRLNEAHGILRNVAGQDPTLWRAWNALGIAQDSKGQWDDAGSSYEQARWAAPSAAVVFNNSGVSLLARGEPAAAVGHFVRSLELDSNSIMARNNLRIALAFDGKYSEALHGADAINLPEILSNVGYIAALNGDLDTATEYFTRSLEMSPSFYEPAWKNMQYVLNLQTCTNGC